MSARHVTYVKTMIARHITAMGTLGQRLREDQVLPGTGNGLILRQRENMLEDLNRLNNIDTDDIYEGLAFWGPHVCLSHLYTLRGEEDLADNIPLLYAVIKLGSPEMTWDDIVAEHDSLSVHARANPHELIGGPYVDRLTAALFDEPVFDPAGLPFRDDGIDLFAADQIFNCDLPAQGRAERWATIAAHVLDRAGQAEPPDESERMRLSCLMTMFKALLADDLSSRRHYKDMMAVGTAAAARLLHLQTQVGGEKEAEQLRNLCARFQEQKDPFIVNILADPETAGHMINFERAQRKVAATLPGGPRLPALHLRKPEIP